MSDPMFKQSMNLSGLTTIELAKKIKTNAPPISWFYSTI